MVGEMSAHYAMCKYDDFTGSYIPLEVRPTTDRLKKDDPLYQEGFQAGAASRDAEVQRLQMALADAEALELGTAEKCDKLRAELANALAACKAKDEAILQENYSLALSFQPDGAGTVTVRLFDLGAKMSFEAQKRLVRELDKIWNGDGAAKQASLCDLVCQLAIEVPKLRTEREAARADAKEAWGKLGEQCIAHTATIHKLAAEQARIRQLRKVLKKTTVALEHRWEVIANRAAPIMEGVIDEAHSEGIIALSTPDDTSALQAIVKKAGEVMREEAKEMILRELSHSTLRINLIDKACVLPAVTLEDLK